MAKAKRAARKPSKAKGPWRKTVKKGRAWKMELKYVPWRSVELEDLNPLLQRQMVVGQKIKVARVLMKKGCVIPLHSHYIEQFT